ncbi:XFP C-terminal domain-containing protein [Zychaea mexicana]|uniref:XFP C-terminal domain-containing protein n=1 Tax=Zychaea mexicana TaxID=64656 RepID=UPI0022FF1AFB|nr:XFP C-terminal domain-containing protein [Zychaea mexicana]KAI9467991.1 XFP C-terminal domain-containing protein [Zychaea mexicana]
MTRNSKPIVFKRIQSTFRIFSPDELTSNKLKRVLDATIRTMEVNIHIKLSTDGRIIEVLSEHTCQGLLQGYTLTGRTDLIFKLRTVSSIRTFLSTVIERLCSFLIKYKRFVGIITTMLIQYAKFWKMGQETLWRRPVPSINYMEKQNSHARFESCKVAHYGDTSIMGSVTKIWPSFISAKTTRSLLWITSAEKVAEHCRAGVSVWSEYSTDGGKEPDVVIVGCGVETTFEAVAAAALLNKDYRNSRVRLVNVTDFMVLGRTHSHRLSQDEFEAIFTLGKLIIFNFYG